MQRTKVDNIKHFDGLVVRYCARQFTIETNCQVTDWSYDIDKCNNLLHHLNVITKHSK